MGPEGDAFHELDIYVDYVVGLKEEDLRSSTLIECYRRFSDHVEEQIKLGKSDSLVSDTSVTCVLLCPVLKWSGQTALSASGKDLLAQVERAIDLVDEALRRGFQPDLLEFQNTLIFCYFVVAEVVQIGLNVYALTSHLQVHRFISAGRWAATPPRIRMQYGAVILRFMLYFYRPEEAFRTQLGFSINALADLRSVFEDAAGSSVDAPFTSHQWVFRWFKDKLDT